jgi:hypothetical protein
MKPDDIFKRHGYTNNQAKLAQVQAYVAAAIADGWEQSIYFDNEPVTEACKLHRDGFKMSVLMRTFTPKPWQATQPWKFTAQISAWGPDGLAIEVGDEYPGFAAIQAATMKCSQCGAAGVVTFQFFFAGRCCAGCLPEARRKYEKPGWCD